MPFDLPGPGVYFSLWSKVDQILCSPILVDFQHFSKSLSCAFKSSSNVIGNGFAHISKRHLYWRSLHTHFIPLGCPATMTLRTNNWKWFKKICCLDHHHPAPALPLPKVLLLNRLNVQAAGRGKQGAALRAHLDVNKYQWQLFSVVSQE